MKQFYKRMQRKVTGLEDGFPKEVKFQPRTEG